MDAREARLKLHNQFNREEEQKHLELNANVISLFKEHCARKGVVLIDDNFSYVQKISGIVATYPSLVKYLCPELTTDKDGLTDLYRLNALFGHRSYAPGYLSADNFMIMAHPYFRRDYNNNAVFSPCFVDKFWKLNDIHLQPSIAIDTDRVRITMDSSMYMEFDHWYGPVFSKDIAVIEDNTTKLILPADIKGLDALLLFGDTFALDIKWNTKRGNIKNFQAEEFKTDDIFIDIDGEPVCPTKYLHAEYDMTKQCFTHFDGAIHFYTPDDYYNRRNSDFNYNAKNSVKIKAGSMKLFRVDGSLTVDTWIDLVGHFLTGNSLVFEYFEGKLPQHIQDGLDAVRNYLQNKS